MAILTKTIMTVQSNLKHLGNMFAVLPVFCDTITTTTTPNSSKLPPPVKEYVCFQTEGKTI